MVPRSIAARFHNRATPGGTKTPISRKPTPQLSDTCAKQSALPTIYVGCCGDSQRRDCTRISWLPVTFRSGRDSRLAPTGEAIYLQGIQSSNIPACVACHGPHGEGVAAIPRIGGLSYHYLKRKLEEWGEGYHAAALAPMPEVASKLSVNDIEALASYLSFAK